VDSNGGQQECYGRETAVENGGESIIHQRSIHNLIHGSDFFQCYIGIDGMNGSSNRLAHRRRIARGSYHKTDLRPGTLRERHVDLLESVPTNAAVADIASYPYDLPFHGSP